MSDDQSSSDSGNSSWIGKLTNMFTDQVDDTKSLVTFLRKAEKNQVIDADGLSIIEGALQVTDMQVREIMIPRSQVATIDITDSPDEIIPKVIQAGHSRFPVIGESKDDVVGILLAKDLLELVLINDQRKFNLKDVLRPAIYVPESKRLNILLKEFRENRNHMAMLSMNTEALAALSPLKMCWNRLLAKLKMNTMSMKRTISRSMTRTAIPSRHSPPLKTLMLFSTAICRMMSLIP